jgi:tetratricopeptide (TPR) repeat protein
VNLTSLALLVGFAGIVRADCPLSEAPAGTVNHPKAVRAAALEYQHAGEYAKACDCWRTWLDSFSRDGGEFPVADLINLANLATVSGKFSEADYYFQAALKRIDDGASNPTLKAELYIGRGWLMQMQGAYTAAETNYNSALQIASPSNNLLNAEALNRLGRLYLQTGRFTDASGLLQRGRVLAEKALPADDSRLTIFFDSEAYLLFEAGRYSEAEKEWLKALNLGNEFGRRDLDRLIVLMHLGVMYYFVGNLNAAEVILTRCLRANEKVVGGDPLDKDLILSTLAATLAKEKKTDEADRIYKDFPQLSDSACNSSPVVCSAMQSNLGDYHVARHQWHQAEANFRKALRVREKALGRTATGLGNCLLSLSQVLRKLKRKKEAKVLEARAAALAVVDRDLTYHTNQTVDVRSFRKF